MRTGLRAQILVWLGALLALAFVPLYYAIATYTDVALARSQSAAAQWHAQAQLAVLEQGALNPDAPQTWGDAPAQSAALHRLLAFYMALVALALLVAVYFAVTTLIIRPLEQFSAAAERVASANQRLQLPKARARELSALAQSLTTMTERLAQDQTDLQRQVYELQQARQQLEQAQGHLVRSERLASVGQLAAGLAHEVGNPLAALQGMQDLILQGDLDAEQQLDFTRRMRKETERISRILRDLLDFARPARAQASTEPGNVEAAIYETAALVAHQPLLRDVELALDVFPDLPLVRLNPTALTQVLLNLLLNAAAACNGEGQVRVSAAPQATGVRLCVADDGSGIAPEIRERIFEPFFSTKEVGEGSGLGLSVCRGLVEAAGGSITLREASQRGACFVVDLPGVEPGHSERTSQHSLRP